MAAEVWCHVTSCNSVGKFEILIQKKWTHGYDITFKVCVVHVYNNDLYVIGMLWFYRKCNVTQCWWFASVDEGTDRAGFICLITAVPPCFAIKGFPPSQDYWPNGFIWWLVWVCSVSQPKVCPHSCGWNVAAIERLVIKVWQDEFLCEITRRQRLPVE